MNGKYKFLILTITGYTENYSRITGGERVREKLIREFDSKDVEIPWPIEWRADWKEVAAYIARHVDRDTTIIVWCYSWGAGWGCLQLAKYLAPYGVNLHHVLMVDPVYRKRWSPTHPQWLAGVTNPRSMMGRSDWGRSVMKIKVPANVVEVSYFRQKQNVPAGRELVPVDPELTTIKDLGYLPYEHGDIDDSMEVMDAILDIASNAIHGMDFSPGGAQG